MSNKLIIAFLTLCAALFTCNSQREAMIISANIEGEQEVPLVQTLAGGSFIGAIGVGAEFMQVRVSASCISGVIASHIHHAEAGKNGQIIVTLFKSDSVYVNPNNKFFVDLRVIKNLFEGEAKNWNWDQFMDEILAGRTYVNIHTLPNHPAGEIRGKLFRYR